MLDSEHLNKQTRKASMTVFLKKYYNDHRVLQVCRTVT